MQLTKNVLKLVVFLSIGSVTALSYGDAASGHRRYRVLDQKWLEKEVQLSAQRIIQNVSPSDARPGAVIAAQTRHEPNYYYHWVRDAGLVMEAVIEHFNRTGNVPQKNILRQKLYEYTDFSQYIQETPSISGLGEPKFHVDGSAFNEPWGRPQNDGPALRALSMIHWAQILIREGKGQYVRTRIYDGKLPTHSVLKRDLEFLAHHWSEPNFDLWEEVKGDHFYTRMVQRRALIEGAWLARTLNDFGAAEYYLKEAKKIENDLNNNYWDESRGHYISTRNRVEGIDYKHSNLDTSVILGLIHGSLNDGFMPFSSPRVQATIAKLIEAFRNTYSINHRTGIPGVAIGRYPEDRYAGNNFNGGNPWPLCTLALSEALYKAAQEEAKAGHKGKARELIAQGDALVSRVQYHAHPDGSLNEQIDRHTGYMTSVSDLTWNYAAILTTYYARSEAVSGL